jgi:hypothetical protein
MSTMASSLEIGHAICNIFELIFEFIQKCIRLRGYSGLFGTTLFITIRPATLEGYVDRARGLAGGGRVGSAGTA